MSTAKKAHYLQHVAFEGLGYIKEWLVQNNFELTGTEFFNSAYQLPDPADLDILVVMGGPMGIYDEAHYCWLTKEKVFIKDCLNKGVKILGICLGAQLLADALGAGVHAAPNKEIGWFKIEPDYSPSLNNTAQNAADSLLHALLQTVFTDGPVVFHWHGDQFDLPPGCQGALRTEANANQAFTYKNQVLALQFHLEVTPQSLRGMLSHGANEWPVHPVLTANI
ncbi:GMP synthase-Glutamine amidotransferase [Arachidicoccus rhizosphaerae]|uniref:GMP synthase-Glutamine amidotransferase n=1 Tax=Arachidicoccus rhizosphaerae TaxID=551991 RepID=A0A1H3YIS6_9BACT|nr:hypothetical protein [Arachidicoccus rhizosphaerae]SEA11101.1 GMP synthase-Glutamine amidotransferase [Arachidicoccus rhizosphaerae]